MTSHDMTSLRARYKNLTRDRIIDAAIELVAESSGETVTIGAVAARCAITERTIYRHFDTRDDLMRAVWPRMQQQVGSSGFPSSATELINRPRDLFPRFDEHAGLVRASINSSVGKELRTSVNSDRQAAMLKCVIDAFPQFDPVTARRRAAVVQLLESADAWGVLKDFWGFDGDEAGTAVSEAIAVLLGRAQAADPKTGDGGND